MTFLHGVEIQEVDKGSRPIGGVKASVIGLVGTATAGSAPFNKPVLISGSRKTAEAQFGKVESCCSYILEMKKEENGNKQALVDGFKTKHTACAVLIIHDANNKRTIAGISATGTLLEKELTDINHELSKELGKDPADDGKIFELAALFLGIDVDVPCEVVPQTNTLPYALNAILDQTAAQIVVVKVADSTLGTTIQSGVEALLGAEGVVHQTPRILIAPGFSHESGVVRALNSAAERLRGVAIVDVPSSVKVEDKDAYKDTDTAAAITHGKSLTASSRLYAVHPFVKVGLGGDRFRLEPASARVAGVIVKSDDDRGYWWSPSNRSVAGIAGTAQPIDFSLGDPLSSANLLNEGNVATIIHQGGYRLWGNRSLSTDPKWVFISVRRTADLINDALQRAHMWAIDRNITKTYVDEVTEGVNAYLRHLKSQGAIINGNCWADPELNTWDQVQQGKVTFDFDFTPPYPAEHITFRSTLVNDYLEEIFA